MSVFDEIRRDFLYIIENISTEHPTPLIDQSYGSVIWYINCRNSTRGRRVVKLRLGMLNLVDLYYEVMKADPWRT